MSNSVRGTEKKSDFEGEKLSAGRLCAGSFWLSSFTESLRQAAKEARPWAQPDDCMLKILVA